jgi:acyl carrier protein
MPMSRAVVLAVICDVLAGMGLPVPADPSVDLFDDLRFDSFDLVDACIAVEDRLDCRLDETRLADVRTVDGFADLVVAAVGD